MCNPFHAAIRGEDGLEFVIELDARDLNAARDEAEELYPEGTILEVYDPAQREREVYERVCRRMDDEDVYHEDW